MKDCYETIVAGQVRRYELTDGLTLAQAAYLHGQTDAICALTGGTPLALNEQIAPGDKVTFLSPLTSEHASRVFLRGATFLLHCAVKALLPNRKLLVDHVLAGGVFCRLDNVTQDDIALVEQKIFDFIKSDAPFVHTRVDVAQAKEALHREGMDQLVRLLKFRPFDYFNLYAFDGHRCYFHGIMPPSAGYLKGTKLSPYLDGFILHFPAPYREETSEGMRQHKYAAVFTQAERWAQKMSASYIADINEFYLEGRMKDFIAVNEALHEKRIAEIAEMISARPDVRIVLIAGPSSSGKTTFAKRLAVHLRVIGTRCRPISVDDYYKDREDTPKNEYGELDFEHIDALDVKKLGDDLDALLRGETAHMPKFDFVRGRRKQQMKPLRIDDELLIIEGIHALNDKLTQNIPADKKFKIFISPLTALNFDSRSTVLPEDLRILRRLARDQRDRGASFAETFNLWESVRIGEYKYILPYQETADVMFNSTLLYEPLVLKKYCYEKLRRICSHEPCYAQAQSLLKFLNYFMSMDDETSIPNNSILREFIGNNG